MAVWSKGQRRLFALRTSIYTIPARTLTAAANVASGLHRPQFEYEVCDVAFVVHPQQRSIPGAAQGSSSRYQMALPPGRTGPALRRHLRHRARASHWRGGEGMSQPMLPAEFVDLEPFAAK